MNVVNIAMEELHSSDGKESWFEVYAILEDGSISREYDEIVPDLETAIKVMRGFVNACFR